MGSVVERPADSPLPGVDPDFDLGWEAHEAGLERTTVEVLSPGSAVTAWDIRERISPRADSERAVQNRAQRQAKIDRAIDESTRMLLDGLEVESIGALKELVDIARRSSAEKRFMEDRAGIYSTAIGLARLALRDDDSAKARQRLDEACDEVHRLHWDALLADGHAPEKIELFLGPRDQKTTTEVRPPA